MVAMEQVWQAAMAGRLGTGTRKVLLCVHDGEPHTGESSKLTRALRSRERRYADGLLVFSSSVRQSLCADRRYTTTPIWETVHPAFDTSESSVRQLDPSRTAVIGFFGRMSPYKGIGLGVESIAELRRRGHRVRFHVVGSGVPGEIAGLDHPDNHVEDRWIHQDEIEQVLSTFDVMLLPYRDASQSGVLAYAMALGIPAVATPVGGLIQQARESGAALVADEVSPTALADALETLLEEPQLYAELSRNGIAAAKGPYSWSRVATDILDAYRGLIDDPAPRLGTAI